jgi:hypothetical protein
MPAPKALLLAVRRSSSDVTHLPQVELTRWLGAAAVKRDFTDKMRDAQKKEVSTAHAMLAPWHCLNRMAACCAAG